MSMTERSSPKGAQSRSEVSRRTFLKQTAIAGILVALGGTGGVIAFSISGKSIGKILADYEKCTGCRTCEAVCPGVHSRPAKGLGNPSFSSIKVYSYNPDVHAPAVCLFCENAPCVEACPVAENRETNRKALVRDKATGAIKVRSELCISCGGCVEACNTHGSGVMA